MITFFDFEISIDSQKIKDIGALKENSVFHSPKIYSFMEFIKDSDFLCGHNIISHDWQYIKPFADGAHLHPHLIDTLYLSPLLFPQRPYHNLLKDDKILLDKVNNPYNDSLKAKLLFDDEIEAFQKLPLSLKEIYCTLLYSQTEFEGFFKYLSINPQENIAEKIIKTFEGLICSHADLNEFINTYPIELAYALALIYTHDKHSVLPAWVAFRFPKVEYIIKKLCFTHCQHGCAYCNQQLNIHKKLKQFFGYDNFRTYENEPLQEKAVQAAVDGKSLLSVFPTGGGKSLTFQLPALMAGENMHALTVVISPLVSLMKDQIDNLQSKDISEAVTINGLLNSLERQEAIKRVEDGSACLLYISPETLRSNTIEKLLCSRNIARFVIDEAHCFSAWGQDFRVDYLYIGKFIKMLQEKKNLSNLIPVSCFTATAKQKVISDICDYFRKELNVELELYSSKADRTNLRYKVIHVENDDDRYKILRNQIQSKNCPTVVYVSRTKKTFELAERLSQDGFFALPFNGKMDKDDKVTNQNKFMRDECQIIVATSAFGMGIDKDNVGLVIHYDISESLENYVQEAGRAGRNPKQTAECVVLFNDSDLDKHFELFNQTKLTINEIQQVWQAIKLCSKTRACFSKSPLEIARLAGWEDKGGDTETRVKAAVAELERAGFIIRGHNSPRVYATSICVNNMIEASQCIEKSKNFSNNEKDIAKNIVRQLISKKYRSKAGNDDAESRVDYIADHMGLDVFQVISFINRLREENILADSQDMQAFIKSSDFNTVKKALAKFFELEDFLLQNMEDVISESYKEINDRAIQSGIAKSTVKDIKSILFFWYSKKYLTKEYDEYAKKYTYKIDISKEDLKKQTQSRKSVTGFIIEYLQSKSQRTDNILHFSLLELLNAYNAQNTLFATSEKATLDDIQTALLYLSKIQILELEGNFLVFYNAMQIRRLELDNKIKYKKENFETLQNYYTQKMQQIHIVGEYANLMTKSYHQALSFVFDYFHLDYMLFIKKYFKGNRFTEIQKNITSQRYNKLFGDLSAIQRRIIEDNASQNIVVTAGPGSGKTKVLVHKLASLLLIEDVKSEQLLMLTFSRAAAIEFKKRLIDLIGSAAYYVDIKTFHSYCFDLMGQIGSVEKSETIVRDTALLIENGDVEESKITKTVLVIDEAQDMSEDEFNLVKALMQRNENMRVIAVGDDDQNIYAFRKSSSKYMKTLLTSFHATHYEMVENYRSDKLIVRFANHFTKTISNRMKTSDLVSLSKKSGHVTLTETLNAHIDEAGLKIFYETYQTGTCAILTHSNDTANRICQNLLEHGYKAKLIQDHNSFTLNNLYELRCFLNKLKSVCKTKKISQFDWDICTEKFFAYFQNSPFIDECMKLLRDFDELNPAKYISDFDIFLQESEFSDFILPQENTVIVSTIHKAKGKEFDNVYLVLENEQIMTDEERRVIFVGLTRAKHFLSVTYANKLFHSCHIWGINKKTDENTYEEMNKIVISLSLKDVNLGYFKRNQSIIKKMVRNNNLSELFFDEDGLSIKTNHVSQKIVQFSKSMMQKINLHQKNGYQFVNAKILCYVYWQDTDEQKEYLTVLPVLHFQKV